MLVISMFLCQTSIVFKVGIIILMSFNWNVIPILCLYVIISLDELFFELAQDYSREEEPPDPGEWAWSGFIVVCNFFYLKSCGARKYIHGQDYVDPSPPPSGVTFPRGGGLQAKPYEVGVWSFFLWLHIMTYMFCSYKRSLWESPDKNLCTEHF